MMKKIKIVDVVLSHQTVSKIDGSYYIEGMGRLEVSEDFPIKLLLDAVVSDISNRLRWNTRFTVFT
jgi:hypothetical protein